MWLVPAAAQSRDSLFALLGLTLLLGTLQRLDIDGLCARLGGRPGRLDEALCSRDNVAPGLGRLGGGGGVLDEESSRTSGETGPLDVAALLACTSFSASASASGAVNAASASASASALRAALSSMLSSALCASSKAARAMLRVARRVRAAAAGPLGASGLAEAALAASPARPALCAASLAGEVYWEGGRFCMALAMRMTWWEKGVGEGKG